MLEIEIERAGAKKGVAAHFTNHDYCMKNGNKSVLLSSSGPGPGPRSGPGQVSGQVQKVQGQRTTDLDLGLH